MGDYGTEQVLKAALPSHRSSVCNFAEVVNKLKRATAALHAG